MRNLERFVCSITLLLSGGILQNHAYFVYTPSGHFLLFAKFMGPIKDILILIDRLICIHLGYCYALVEEGVNSDGRVYFGFWHF